MSKIVKEDDKNTYEDLEVDVGRADGDNDNDSTAADADDKY